MNPEVIRVPIYRLAPDEHMIYGFASTGALDGHDTVFDPSWWPHAISGYLQDRRLTAMHENPNVRSIGTVPIIEIDDRGLWIGANVTDPDEWRNIETGVYNDFSVAAWPLEAVPEVREGKTITRYTKYVLRDITIGPIASNPESHILLVERLAYDAESPWDWNWGKDADEIVALLGWKGLGKACLYTNPDADPETKAAYKLPVAKLRGGELTVHWNGVRAAMAVLNGGRGELDIPEDARKAIYTKIKNLYAQFDKETPELRLDNGGNTMSKFADKVSALVKRLTGKDPDENTRTEIAAIETDLADERTKQIETLTGSVTDLTERLQKLETSDGKGGDTSGDEGKKQMDTLTASVKGIEERLGLIEKRTATSQQPGESGDKGGGQPPKKGMNDFIRASARR